MKNLLSNIQYLPLYSKMGIGYLGWLNHGNLGDEAMYLSFKKLFCTDRVLQYKHSDKIRRIEELFKKPTYKAVCLGGGTLINTKGELPRFKDAQKIYRKTFVFGAGVRNPIFWKARYNEDYLKEWIECLERCGFVGVRGPVSQKILSDNGYKNAEVIGDPALFFARETIKRKNKRKILGINIGLTNGKMYGTEGQVLEFTVKFMNIMIEKGWEIVFLPVTFNDIKYIEEAVKKALKPVKVFREFQDINKVMDILETFDVFVGEKLHSVILAMCAYTPSVMWEYRPKCFDFMSSMNFEFLNLRTDELTVDVVIDRIIELEKKSVFYQDQIYKKAQEYKGILISSSRQIREKIDD